MHYLKPKSAVKIFTPDQAICIGKRILLKACLEFRKPGRPWPLLQCIYALSINLQSVLLREQDCTNQVSCVILYHDPSRVFLEVHGGVLPIKGIYQRVGRNKKARSSWSTVKFRFQLNRVRITWAFDGFNLKVHFRSSLCKQPSPPRLHRHRRHARPSHGVRPRPGRSGTGV